MECACGCGRQLPRFDKLNRWGELETMRPDCILEGLGTPFSIDEYLWRVWNDQSLIDSTSTVKERLGWMRVPE